MTSGGWVLVASINAIVGVDVGGDVRVRVGDAIAVCAGEEVAIGVASSRPDVTTGDGIA